MINNYSTPRSEDQYLKGALHLILNDRSKVTVSSNVQTHASFPDFVLENLLIIHQIHIGHQ